MAGHFRRRCCVLYDFRRFRHGSAVEIWRPPGFHRSRCHSWVWAGQMAVRPHHRAVITYARAFLVRISDVINARPRRIGALVYAILSRHRTVLSGRPVRVVSEGFALHAYAGVRARVRGRVGGKRRVVLRHRAVVAGVPRAGFRKIWFDYLAGIGARLCGVWAGLRGVRTWLSGIGARLS